MAPKASKSQRGSPCQRSALGAGSPAAGTRAARPLRQKTSEDVPSPANHMFFSEQVILSVAMCQLLRLRSCMFFQVLNRSTNGDKRDMEQRNSTAPLKKLVVKLQKLGNRDSAAKNKLAPPPAGSRQRSDLSCPSPRAELGGPRVSTSSWERDRRQPPHWYLRQPTLEGDLQ